MAIGLAIGTTISAGGQIFGGIQASKAAKKQQRQLDNQALLERQAVEFEAVQQARQFDELLGRQKLNIAASGIKLEGSPLLLIEETLRDKEETISNILKFGAAKSDALKSQAENARDVGRNAFTGSIVGAFGTILSPISTSKSKQIGGSI